MKMVRKTITALFICFLSMQACSAKNFTPAQFEQAGLHYKEAKVFWVFVESSG